MPQKLTATSDIHDLSALHFAPETFEPIYNTIVGLKFPVDVARVLELRYLINHAVDAFPEPAPTSDYRDFKEALQTVIDETGVERKGHSERLLRILCMMRELHYAYSVNMRDAENKLRARMAANRTRRRHSIQCALGFFLATILTGIFWLGLGDPEWPIKALTVTFAVGAWLYIRTLPSLDRALTALEKEMTQLQRHRVRSIHWRTLVQKLSLVLGYKRNSDVEVFILDSDGHDQVPPSRLHH